MPKPFNPDLSYHVGGYVVTEHPDFSDLLMDALLLAGAGSVTPTSGEEVHSDELPDDSEIASELLASAHHLNDLSTEYRSPEQAHAELEQRGLIGLSIGLLVEHEDSANEAAERLEADLLELGFAVERLAEPARTEVFQALGNEIPVLIAVASTLVFMPVPPAVILRTPQSLLFVGSYIDVPVEINPSSGIAFDDLEFSVIEGPSKGIISPSLTTGFAGHAVMLLAGDEPGIGTLRVSHKTTGVTLAEATFELTTYWSSDEVGPNFWMNGAVTGSSISAAWGGGAGGVQNHSVKPAKGTKSIAILLVDTKSQRWPTSANAIKAEKKVWRDACVDGVVVDGKKNSAAHYFKELSLNKLDLDATVYGPVSMPKQIDEYLASNNHSKSTFDHAVVDKASKLIDYSKIDILVIVLRSRDMRGATSIDPGAKQRGVWPTAWSQTYSTQGKKISFRVAAMPSHWGNSGRRSKQDTLTHEIGHTLGLGDQYRPSVLMPNPPPSSRNIGGWDLMDSEDGLPHLTLYHRLILGWVEASWLKSIDFSKSTAPFKQTFKLAPINKGKPSAGRLAGLEIRIADGKNWYVEYRRRQPNQIGDKKIPADGRIIVTDAVSASYSAPITRPAILRVPNDSDKDGSVLSVGDDYKRTDWTDAMSPEPFILKVINASSDEAEVEISYAITGRPDPSIRPWPASNKALWQSPDIEVRNSRNKADAKWKNVPWANNKNTVVAKVKNRGGIDAPKVSVNFFVKNFNIGGGAETPLGSDTKDIAEGATAEFSTTWMPPKQGHFCVVARIPLYQIPAAPQIVELTELNNMAQSNYTRFISKKSSPPTRERTQVQITNPYDSKARFLVEASQDHPLYRTYLGTRWLTLESGESRSIEVMFEYAPDEANRLDIEVDLLESIPNRVNFVGLGMGPESEHSHSTEVIGGACIEVVQGWATEIEGVDPTADRVYANVRAIDSSAPIPTGKLVAKISEANVSEPKYNESVVINGYAEVGLPASWSSLRLYFIPDEGFGESESERISNPF